MDIQQSKEKQNDGKYLQQFIEAFRQPQLMNQEMKRSIIEYNPGDSNVEDKFEIQHEEIQLPISIKSSYHNDTQNQEEHHSQVMKLTERDVMNQRQGQTELRKNILEPIIVERHDNKEQKVIQEQQNVRQEQIAKNQNIDSNEVEVGHQTKQQMHQNQQDMINIESQQFPINPIIQNPVQLQQNIKNQSANNIIYSHSIEQRKDITQILQQRKQRLQGRYKKSQKMRATITKLEPIASKKDSQLRSTLNNIKITQTIQFLQNKALQRVQQKIMPTQWRQQRLSKQRKIQQLISKHGTPQKKSSQGVKFIGISPTKSKRSKDGSNQRQSNSLPKLQKKMTIPRPMPYNLYNLYQRQPQMFKLNSLANP